ncbi:MAG: NAD(P)/FAD-dependent oxidoreductase [Saprospiraceae bacterium]|nr:NAD(P)/FAD-dependent oxidoreductase [Saprospiraceae bacterium]MCB9329145.1 NAD(P)/FAD-dependent oxidoreductase [Lewinellaceae bacterium]
MTRTDIIIVGAGPVGLFTVFEAGLLKLKCHLVDVLGQPGGQLTEIYPKKPIYDIPGYPSVLASELVDNLMKQIEPFNPEFTLGEKAEKIEKIEDSLFKLTTDQGTEICAPVIAIAGGLGSFEPRKPPLENLEKYEGKGVDYIVKDPEKYRDRDIVIAGGGDSALDWTIYLAEIAKSIKLIHRRSSFRGAIDSVEKVMELANSGKVDLITNAQVTAISGANSVESVTVETSNGIVDFNADYFIPLFGLTPKLGPIGEWGLEIEDNAIKVNTYDYSTNIPGIYAIGDINTYPGKLKLILCGFHEGTLMVQSAFKHIYPDQKLSFKYTTVTGISGLE